MQKDYFYKWLNKFIKTNEGKKLRSDNQLGIINGKL